METLLQDVTYGVRMLVRTPGVAATAILALALGIGANTALFSVVNGVLLTPLAYPDSGQLVVVSEKRPGLDQSPPVYLNFLDWQRQNRTFSSMAIYRNQDYSVTGLDQARRLSGLMISAGFFATLGVVPVLGRTLRADDDQVGSAPVAVIGGGFWSRELGGAPDVIGKPLILNGTAYTIVGVIPPSFTFYGRERDVYTPIGQWNDSSFRDRRISVSAHVIGRLKPDVTLSQAAADMGVVARNLSDAFPVADKGVGITLVSMKEDIVGNVQPLLLILLAAVGFLLLIACANIGNLLLARSLGRSREFAVRAALGAGRIRIIRQLLTESVLLAASGGALGLLFAFTAARTAFHALPATLPRVEHVALDGRVLLFTTAISLAAAGIFGLVPAIRSAQTDLNGTLKEGGRGAAGLRHRMQAVFVVIQVAMAVILLIGASLMLRSLSALWRVNLGYNPSHAITFNLSMPSSATTTSAETRARLRQFDDKMRSIPGVQAVSATLGSRPLIHDSSLPLWIEGRPKPVSDNEMPAGVFYLVEEGFKDAMGISLERGRFVTSRDNETSPIVIDIDDAFARIYFRGEDPIGRRVHLEQFNVEAEIVGVVGHIKQWGPGGDAKSSIQAQFFYPFMQLPEKVMPLAAGGVAVVLRVAGEPAAIMKLVRAAVQELDPREVVYGEQMMEDVVAGSLAARKFAMILQAVFAAIAVVLCCVGIYGVVSYVVGQRAHEIGVRMALGARPQDITGMVLGEGARMGLVGIAVGITGAFGLTRLIANQLFGVTAHDPFTFAAVVILLSLVALLACFWPARRAALVDPVVALRAE